MFEIIISINKSIIYSSVLNLQHVKINHGTSVYVNIGSHLLFENY